MLKRKIEFFENDQVSMENFRSLETDLNIEFEEHYTADSGNSTIIPMNSQWSSVIVLLSGGLDSGLLLYLIAKTIKDHKLNVKITPVSIDVPTKAKNLESARIVIDKIRMILDVDFINDAVEIIMPMDTAMIADEKSKFYNDSIFRLEQQLPFDFSFNGNTKNPKEEIRKHFINDDCSRMQDRDIRTSIYNGSKSCSPHVLMDKNDIINLYIKYNLLEELALLTVSCDQNLNVIMQDNLDVPCNLCWWCDERRYGFESNNLDYVRYSPKNLYFRNLAICTTNTTVTDTFSRPIE